MASINRQSPANGFDKRRVKIVLSAVYGLLSAVNLVMMITEPTAWQGAFATVLLVAALWLWFDTQPRTTS
jgi:nitrogen fixation protein FixH